MNLINQPVTSSLFADVEFHTTDINGAPFRIGQLVEVVAIEDVGLLHLMGADDDDDIIGLQGAVVYLDYDSQCGQSFPEMPLVGIKLASGKIMAFWPDELAASSKSLLRQAA